jgi:hypothetical protein
VPKPKSLRAKMLEYRERLRLIQILAPDVCGLSFPAEAHRQSAAVATSAHAQADQAFIDSMSE